ncbi:hypothetical protein MMC27_003117 [Xylographa pallens]|nr:hypothetical protein [Xylographa pallens]
MRERGRDIKTEAELDETGEIAYNAAGVEAEAEVETAIGPRKVCQTSNFARFRIIPYEKIAPSRSERQRTRSRSPVRNGASMNPRMRSPPRKPNVEVTRPPTTKPSEPQPSTAPVVDKMQIDSPTIDPVAPTKSKSKSKTKPKAAPEEDSDPEIAQMRTLMGFAGFKTTKDTKVPGNNVYAVRKEKKTEYRQYMNRVGGFNRPLSPSR